MNNEEVQVDRARRAVAAAEAQVAQTDAHGEFSPLWLLRLRRDRLAEAQAYLAALTGRLEG